MQEYRFDLIETLLELIIPYCTSNTLRCKKTLNTKPFQPYRSTRLTCSKIKYLMFDAENDSAYRLFAALYIMIFPNTVCYIHSDTLPSEPVVHQHGCAMAVLSTCRPEEKYCARRVADMSGFLASLG